MGKNNYMKEGEFSSCGTIVEGIKNISYYWS